MKNKLVILSAVIFFTSTIAVSQQSAKNSSLKIWNKFMNINNQFIKEKERKKYIIFTSAYTGTKGSVDYLTGRRYPGKSYNLKVYIGYGYRIKRDSKGFYLDVEYRIFKRGSASKFCSDQEETYRRKYRLYQDIDYNDQKAYYRLSTGYEKKLPYWSMMTHTVCVYPEGKYQNGISKMLKRLNNAQDNFLKKLEKRFSFSVDLKEYIDNNTSSDWFEEDLDKDLDNIYRIKG